MKKDKYELDKCLAENPAVGVAMNLRASKLTKRQIAFVLNYAGDPHEAALKAGYKDGSAGIALLRNNMIIDAIIERDNALDKLPKDTDPAMNLVQLRTWWTENIVDEDLPMNTRVKCSELLAKSYGAFVDKVVKGDQYNQTNINQASDGPLFTVTIKTYGEESDQTLEVNEYSKQNFIADNELPPHQFGVDSPSQMPQTENLSLPGDKSTENSQKKR